MRFTEGVWYGREDVDVVSAQEVGKLDFDGLDRPYYPSLSPALPALKAGASAQDIHADELRALFHTRPVKNRGDTLNKPTLTATITSPCPGIIGVEVSHFKARSAQPEPRVELFPHGGRSSDPSRLSFGPNDKTTGQPASISLSSANDQSRVDLDLDKGSFGIRFYGAEDNGAKLLTEIRADSLSWVLDKNASPKDAIRENAVTTISDPYHREPVSRRQSYMKVGLNLAVGEKVYGLGERFGPFIKNGQTIEVSNEDGGTSSASGMFAKRFDYANEDKLTCSH